VLCQTSNKHGTCSPACTSPSINLPKKTLLKLLNPVQMPRVACEFYMGGYFGVAAMAVLSPADKPVITSQSGCN